MQQLGKGALTFAVWSVVHMLAADNMDKRMCPNGTTSGAGM